MTHEHTYQERIDLARTAIGEQRVCWLEYAFELLGCTRTSMVAPTAKTAQAWELLQSVYTLGDA